MASTRTPRYVVAYTTTGGAITNIPWQHKYEGRPTAANLVKHVAVREESFRPGGCNEHIGAAYPEMKILGARIIDQYDRSVVATYEKA